MEIGNEPGQVPEIILKNPPTRLFAYVNSYPNEQVMGVTIDGNTGRTIQAVILPTKQRVMLGLGIGNDDANAHHTYRQEYPGGYHLFWSDDPDTDPRLARLRERLEQSVRELRKNEVHVTESQAQSGLPATQEADGALVPVGELTTQLMRAGAEGAKSSDRDARDPTPPVPEQQDAGDTPASPGDQPPANDSHGGFF